MKHLHELPAELLDAIIEQLVIEIGLYKAVLLRTVNQAFDSSIFRTICFSPAIDIDDRAAHSLFERIDQTFRGRIVAAKSLHACVSEHNYISVVASTSKTINSWKSEHDESRIDARQHSIARAVRAVRNICIDAQMEAQNLLCAAAVCGELDIVRMLVQTASTSHHPVDVNMGTPFFEHPLNLAAAGGHLDVVLYLLEQGATQDAVCAFWHKRATLSDWSRGCRFSQISYLSQRPPTALRTAVSHGHWDIMKCLLLPQHQLPMDDMEYLRAILEGAAAGRWDFSLYLLEVVGKPLRELRTLGEHMLWTAIQRNQKDVVQCLLEHGIDINAHCQRMGGRLACLPVAACLGRIDMVRFLLDHGAGLQTPAEDKYLSLPVEEAAGNGQEEVMKLLLDLGSDPELAFLSAATCGQVRILKILLKLYPDMPQRRDGTLLGRAFISSLSSRSLTVMTALVEAGLPLNKPVWPMLDDSGLPINMAKDWPCDWVVDHLVSLGAHPTPYELPSVKTERRSSKRGVTIDRRTWNWVSKY